MNILKVKKMLRIIILIFASISIISNVNASEKTEEYGDIFQVLIPSIAYGSTFYLGDSEGRKQFYKSFASTFVITHGLKNLINKKRPNGSDKSFPSGHTSAAFQGASFIHKRYGLKYAVPAYVGAIFVGHSRVKSNNHYWEDVIVGAALGTASSIYFTKSYKGFNISPLSANGFHGISVSKTW